MVTTALHPRTFAVKKTNIENGDARASSPRPVENSKSEATSRHSAMRSAFSSGRMTSSVRSMTLSPILLQIFFSSTFKTLSLHSDGSFDSRVCCALPQSCGKESCARTCVLKKSKQTKRASTVQFRGLRMCGAREVEVLFE